MAGFWTRFARRVNQLGDLTLLENQSLPIIEVNAAYSDQPINQAILICPATAEGSTLNGSELTGTLVALEVQTAPLRTSIWVEQVAWTQAALIARVWCNHCAASDWLALVTRELARSLEVDPDLVAYMVYSGDDAVGMMIASSDGFSGWWAGPDDVAAALFARGASDFGRLVVSVPLARRDAFKVHIETARFNLWLGAHQPSDAQTKRLSAP